MSINGLKVVYHAVIDIRHDTDEDTVSVVLETFDHTYKTVFLKDESSPSKVHDCVAEMVRSSFPLVTGEEYSE